MKRFKVTYYIGDVLKEVIIEAEHTNDVFGILEAQEPAAHTIKIEPITE